jgi:hypothetical protein
MGNIFLTAQLRSGSSHVAKTLSILTGHTVGYLMPQFDCKGNEEHVINPMVLQQMQAQGKWVYHIHAKGTNNHRYLLKGFKLRPIVIIRGVKDSLVSVKEQLDVGAEFPGFIRPNWESLDEDERWHLILVYIAPWFTSFQASWFGTNAHVVWYKELFKDPVKQYQQMLALSGHSATKKKILAAHTSHESNLSTWEHGQMPDKWAERLRELP